MQHYNKVTRKVISKLQEICGEKNVIYSKEELENYACDEGDPELRHLPEVVIKPNSAEQISKTMKLANENLIPVTPRGAGSGLAGADIPIYGGIVISFEKMNKILEIDKVNRVAVVEPGVVTNELCSKVLDEGLFYAGYPMSVETSFIGGNVATNAGGGKVIKYGNTRKHILGLEVVLATGETVMLGGKFRKSTWGYDLLDLMIGSEGTLGIFTKIIVNLLPAPGKTVDLLVPFKSVDSAVKAFANAVLAAKIIPISVELLDKIVTDATTKYLNTSLPFQDKTEAYLLITLEGKTKEELEASYISMGQTLIENGALDVFIADSRTNSEKLWKVRREALEGLKFVDPYVCAGGDVVVPVSHIPDIIDVIRNVSKKYKTVIPIVGHIGDGNLHPAPLKPESVSIGEWEDLSKQILTDIVEAGVKMGGVGSGEHGIGIEKRSIFLNVEPETKIKLMRNIKRVFDPNLILNPGKVI